MSRPPVRLSHEGICEILGKTPHFDRCPGPASRAYLWLNIFAVLKEVLSEKDLKSINLLAGGIPREYTQARGELSGFRSKGITDNNVLRDLALSEQGK